MSADAILDRLTGVRQTRHNTWLARCPAHEDSSPSLSIRLMDAGHVLLHCFAGCQTAEILAAVALDWPSLFPPRDTIRPPFQYQRRIPASTLLELISEETSVVAIVAADILARRTISEADWQRLAQAASRIGRARDHVHG